MATQPPNLFPNIGQIAEHTDAAEAEGESELVQEISSLCMKCEEQGMTRLMLTTIPFFRQVVIMSFRCPHCGFANNEIQSAGEIQDHGTIHTVHVKNRSPDLNRQLIRSPTATITIRSSSSIVDLTLPPSTSRGRSGQLTTVEGLVRDVLADLSGDQPLRKYQDPEGYARIGEICAWLAEVAGVDVDGEEATSGEPSVADAEAKVGKEEVILPPFTLALDDPAGNSFVEFIGHDRATDTQWSMKTYKRTLEMNVALGLVSEDEEASSSYTANSGIAVEVAPAGEEGQLPEPPHEPTEPDEITPDEIFTFPGTCSSCGHPIDTLMKRVNIPYFKDILLISTNCLHCGYRDNEVKSGSAISEKGKRTTLRVEGRDDLSRDILKSETAGLTIPSLALTLTHGTLGGRFTTVEGILDQIYEELSERGTAFFGGRGDSTLADINKEGEDEKSDAVKFEEFLRKLKSLTADDASPSPFPYTLILDDPLANSYIQNLYAPDPDPQLDVEVYERSWEQDEELGLNDMRVEDDGEGNLIGEEEKEMEEMMGKGAHAMQKKAET